MLKGRRRDPRVPPHCTFHHYVSNITMSSGTAGCSQQPSQGSRRRDCPPMAVDQGHTGPHPLVSRKRLQSRDQSQGPPPYPLCGICAGGLLFAFAHVEKPFTQEYGLGGHVDRELCGPGEGASNKIRPPQPKSQGRAARIRRCQGPEDGWAP